MLSPINLVPNLHPYENGKFEHLIGSANMADSYRNQTNCLSASDFDVSVDRATGKIGHIQYKHRSCVQEENILTIDAAKDVADWLLTQGKTNVTLQLAYQLSKEQREILKSHVNPLRFMLPRREVIEDKWFARRFVGELNYSFGTVYVDLRELRLLPNSVSQALNPLDKSNSAASLFELQNSREVKRPDVLSTPQIPTKVDSHRTAQVWFNGNSFSNVDSNSILADLFHPPVVEAGSCLIFADYFPKFLIDTQRQGNTLTLRGQLPGKGHEAVIKLGSKEATVDGKPFTLSGAPQEIDGRLYLPYELLRECNGVLVRWDEKKNTLWVDTRYLRRP